MDWTNTIAAVQEAEKHGTVGVSLIGPGGSRWSHNGQRQFRAASIVKIPLMIEVFRRVESGDVSLDDRHTLTAEEKAPGSGVMLHLHDGIELTLRDLVYLMISISDNTATNMLIRLAGMPAVNDTIRDIGMTKSNLGREMKGRPAIEGEEENWASPDDYALVVQAILDGRVASGESCRQMIEMLNKQQNTRRIARYIPQNNEIEWGTKTGTIKGVTNDVGYVRSENGALVIAVLCEDMEDHHRGEQVIGGIARAALIDTGVVEPSSLA